MKDITIQLPADLRQRAVDHARQTGQTLSELVQQGLETLMLYGTASTPRSDDPLFADDWTPSAEELKALGDDGVSYVAERHDEFLYDEP